LEGHALEDKARAHKLLQLFLSDLPQCVDTLRAVVGAMQLAQLKKRLEEACRSESIVHVEGMLPELEGLAMATQMKMQDWLGDKGEGKSP